MFSRCQRFGTCCAGLYRTHSMDLSTELWALALGRFRLHPQTLSRSVTSQSVPYSGCVSVCPSSPCVSFQQLGHEGLRRLRSDPLGRAGAGRVCAPWGPHTGDRYVPQHPIMLSGHLSISGLQILNTNFFFPAVGWCSLELLVFPSLPPILFLIHT